MAPRKKKPIQQPTSSAKSAATETARVTRRMSTETVQEQSKQPATTSKKPIEVNKPPVKKVVKSPKPVLLPTRPPSARRLKKLGLIKEDQDASETTEDDMESETKTETLPSAEEITVEIPQEIEKSPEAQEFEIAMETVIVENIETETVEISQQLENLAVEETVLVEEIDSTKSDTPIEEIEEKPVENTIEYIIEEIHEPAVEQEEIVETINQAIIEDEPAVVSPENEITVECVTEETLDDKEDNSSSVKEENPEIPEEIAVDSGVKNNATIEEIQNNSEDSKTNDNNIYNAQEDIKIVTGIVEENVAEVKPKSKKKTTKAPKETKPPSKSPVSSKKKEKPSKKKKSTIEDENLVRRSSRIKTISNLKKEKQGRGLVKSKTDSDLSENSNSGNTESEKSTPIVSPCSNADSDTKPERIKTRWSKGNETEVASFNMITSSNNVSINEALRKTKLLDSEVQARLKQFVHLKENLYLTDRLTCKEAKKMVCDCFLTTEDINKGDHGCGDDCLNRLLMIECGNLCPVGERCTNKRFQKSQVAPVEVFKTEKKGLGLRAAANIPYGEFILEYIGEVLDPDEFEKRAEDYSKIKNLHYYFMSLRADAVIDATAKGNISRFINHSCDPNAETQKWTVNGELRIGFFSTRTILAGEEVTFDYRFQRYGKEAQKCFCGAAICRGWLGEEPDDEDEDEDDDEDDEEEEDEEEEEEEEETPQLSSSVSSEQPSTAQMSKEDKTITELKKEEASQRVEIKDETSSVSISEEATAVVKKSPVKKEKKPKKEKEKKVKEARPKRRPRMEVLEDLDLDTEIDMLVTTGLKNQSHTLKLSRLIVRAKDPTQRAKLLRILRRGELPCRRLFLDYHGLRLIHGYMTDAQHLANADKKFESLRLELLQTLATLPIPNKTMLQDSKVLSTVEKWSKSEVGNNSPLDSESNSPKSQYENANNSPKEEETVTTKMELPSFQQIKEEPNIIQDNDSELEIRKSVGMTLETWKNKPFVNRSGQSLANEIFESFENDSEEVEVKVVPVKTVRLQKEPNYLEEIVALALKLLEEWSNLKESFRIPKKERIEQMKLHEREANKRFFAGLGSEVDEKRNDNRYRNQRYRPTDKRDSPVGMSKGLKPEERYPNFHIKMSRQHRRKLFAMEVEAKEEERRRMQREMWVQHEKHCLMIGTDPRFTAPFDPKRGYQCIWNPQIGQWQTIPLPPQNLYNLPNTSIPPPHVPTYPYTGIPNMQLTVPPIIQNIQQIPISNLQLPPLQTLQNLQYVQPPMSIHNIPKPSIPLQNVMNIQYQKEEKEDLSQVKFMGPIPPPVKLPPKWKCAKDKYGRPYYYHIKIRKSQWEPPSLLEPSLLEPDIEYSSDSSSSSDTSTFSSDSNSEEDSDDEIDDTKLLQQVRKQMEKQAKLVFKPSAVPSHVSTEENETPSPADDSKASVEENDTSDLFSKYSDFEGESSIDKRLKEQFNLLKDDKGSTQPPSKKRRTGLCQEILISPRTEEDRQQFKEDVKRYKQNKEELKRQKEMILKQTKRQAKEKLLKEKYMKEKLNKITIKSKWKEMNHDNSESAKKIKENFRSNMANVVVNSLNFYRKPDCKEGRITNTEDFKHLARKLTHFVMLKEMKHISKLDELQCTENVKTKAREYIKKYMAKFGETYQKRDDEPDNYY